MCMGIPAKLVSVDGIAGTDTRGDLIDLSLVPEARPGDWVLCFLGTAHEVIDADRAASIAAAFDGPKTRKPAARRSSATPAASGASGPITARSMAFSSQKAMTSGPDRMSRSTSRATLSMPALPGATNSRSHLGFCRIAQASACSRPPPPRIRMFMAKPLLALSAAF